MQKWERSCPACGDIFVVDSVASALTAEFRLCEMLGEEYYPGRNPFTGGEFNTAWGSTRKYCYSCSPRGKWFKYGTGNKSGDRPHRWPDYCPTYSRDYYLANRDRIKEYKKKWSRSEKGKQSAKLGSERRRAYKLAAFVEDVHLDVVAEKYDNKCGICGDVVDFTAEPFTPLSPVKDHIIPLSKGGEHSYANIQLAHWSCNAQKSNKTEGWQDIKPIMHRSDEVEKVQA